MVENENDDIPIEQPLKNDVINDIVKKLLDFFSDYLISKWRTWFASFDHNKDGKVCYADMEKHENFTKLSHLEGEKKKKVDESFTKWWVEYVLWGKDELTVDKNKFIERIQKCEDTICHFVDTAGDGFVSEEEFILIFKAGGHGDVDLDRKFYEQFKPVDHKVSIDDMMKYWTHYLTSEDNSIPDPVKRGLDGGV